MTSYRGLGFDPAPGDPRRVSALAEALAETGRHLADGHEQIAGALTASGSWLGAAAEGFRRQGTGLSDQLAGHRGPVGSAADILFGWASTLSDLRLRAEQQDRLARGLRARIEVAQQAVDEWTTAVSVASTHTRAAAEATLAEHENVLAGLRTELSAVLDVAGQIAAEHRRAADQTTARLRALVPAGGAASASAGSTAASTAGSTIGIGVLLAGLSTATRRAAAAARLPRTSGSGDPPAGALALALAPPPAEPTRSWVFGRAVPAETLRAALPTTGDRRDAGT